MARYEISYKIPMNELHVSPIEEYLERQKYDFSFVLSEDGLSAVLTLDSFLDDNSFQIISQIPHTKEFVRIEN